MPSILAQLLLNGIIAGAIYALVAAGFSLICSVMKFMHFAHGGVVAAGAYFLFMFSQWFSPVPAILLALVTTVLFGVFMDWSVYKQLRKRHASNAVLLIASIGLMILTSNLILIGFGADVKTIPLAQHNPVYGLLGARITLIQIVIIATSALLFGLLYYLMKCTRLGKALRAVADNNAIAQTVGINPSRMYLATFILGSALGGIAGMLIGLEQNLYPSMGLSLVIKGFTGAVIGGVTSVHGSILGALVLGMVENLGIWYLPSGYKDAIAFVLLFVFLLVKPEGLLGKRFERG